MEAAAMGLPSVLTDVRGCRQVVTHGRNGFLVPVGDVPALAEALLALLTDAALARRMGEEGRRRAWRDFDEQRVFATVLLEYERLLRERGLVAAVPAVPERPEDGAAAQNGGAQADDAAAETRVAAGAGGRRWP
jgi:hypothetical protein